MALAFTLGQPCAGGNHWDVTVAGFGGQPIVLPITYSDLLEPLSEEELLQLASLYLRHLVSTHPNAPMATIRTKLANVSVSVRL